MELCNINMEKLTGKTLFFTDIHFGLKNNSTLKLNICVKVIKEIIKKIKTDKIENCIFAGDLFHNRINLSVDTINIVIKCISALSKVCNLYLIVGNHDTYNKNTLDVNSINIFKDTPNVNIIDKDKFLNINGKITLLCPWLSDLSIYKNESVDMLVGHFEVSTKYLIASYIEENSNKNVSNENLLSSMMENDSHLKYEITDLDKINISKYKSKKSAGDLVGSFIDVVKKDGIIFSGHIHRHKEFRAKGRRFIFIGSPYEQHFGDMGNECGYYILDEDSNYKFYEIENIPKHVELKMSNLINNLDNFNYKEITGNIIQRIYDVEVDRIVDSKITQKLLDAKPFEELVPRFDVVIEENNLTKQQLESINAIKKTKLEYIRNYIDNIDKEVLEQQQLNKDILFNYLESYYKSVLDI